jgi:hypothetical protein
VDSDGEVDDEDKDIDDEKDISSVSEIIINYFLKHPLFTAQSDGRQKQSQQGKSQRHQLGLLALEVSASNPQHGGAL